MLTVTAFSDLTSLLNNHCDSPRSVAPVGVYTETDQRHLVRNEQLRVFNFVQLKKKGSIKKFWLYSLFFFCMNVNDRQEQCSRIYNLLFYTFFNNSDLLYDLFWSSSFEQINLLTKKHLGFFLIAKFCNVFGCICCILRISHRWNRGYGTFTPKNVSEFLKTRNMSLRLEKGIFDKQH